MRIEVYPSAMPGEPIEVHNGDGYATLHEWLTTNCPSYRRGAHQPISATCNGVLLDPATDWDYPPACQGVIELRPNPQGVPALAWWIIGGALLAAVALQMLMPKPGMAGGAQGKEIASGEFKANTPKLNQIIPEIAGRYRVWPDCLCQPIKRFTDTRTEAMTALLCIGVGEFQIDPAEVLIGETQLTTLGDAVSYQVYGPGVSIAGHAAHQNWYNVPEVGATRAGAGLRLIDEPPTEQSGTPSTVTGSAVPLLAYAATPVTFTLSGNVITLDQDYVDAAALVADINSFLVDAPIVVSTNTDGYLVATETYPYSGNALTLTGTTTDAWGATLAFVVGSITVGLWVGPFRLTPPNEATNQIEFDVFAPRGLGHVNGNSVVPFDNTRVIEVQYRVNGGAWVSILRSLPGASRDQLGWTFAVTLPASYSNMDFRARRWGAESERMDDLDRLELYGMRCLLQSPTSYAGITTMAITLNGSDKISSSSENQINLIVQRKINGVATRSIDDWVRYICTDIGYGATDVNEAELTALAATWDARGDWFDNATTDVTTVKDAISAALRVGFAELTIDAGKIRPVRDQARTVYEHLYTPQNMVSPLRRQFSAYDPDDFDGVDVEYMDGTSWEMETVQCRLPGDVGLRVEKIKLEGVTSRTRAWRIGMRARRAQAYRRKTFSFSTEWDALNSRYLSYCALSDDVPGYGQSAILTAVNGFVLTVSEPFTWKDGASHVVALRRPDGTLCGPFPATRVSDYTIDMAGSLDFAPITQASSIEPTHVIFGTTTTWSYPVLITEITPNGDTVEVKAVNYDARIYADDDNSAPSI